MLLSYLRIQLVNSKAGTRHQVDIFELIFLHYVSVNLLVS